MGDRYPANEHGIYSTSLYYLYGCWLRSLIVRAVTARRLLVGGTREAIASCAVCSNHSASDSYVFARSLGPHPRVRPLSNLLSPLASNPDGSGDRLACKKCLATRDRHCSLGPHGAHCCVLDALGTRAVSRQETM